MKKLFLFFLAVTMVVSLFTACSAEPGTQSDAPAGNSTPAQSSPTDGSENGTEPPAETKPLTIAETLLYQDEEITVKATGTIVTDSSYWGFEVSVENHSEQDISFGSINEQSCWVTGESGFLINGISMTGYGSVYAAAGTTATDKIYFFYSDLEDAGIDVISTLECMESNLVIPETAVKAVVSYKLETSATDHIQEIDDSGEVLFQQDGITIIYKGSEYHNIYLLVKNETDQTIDLEGPTTNAPTVNDFSVRIMGSFRVYGGSSRVCKLDFWRGPDDERQGLSPVERASLILLILEPGTGNVLLETGALDIQN